MKELLSIIVPAYNIEKYIAQCLSSLIRQTYNNLEIIVVDDGSTDKTPKIIDDFCKIDSRINVIHKENEGVSIARLEGMKISCGIYVGFVDGDDIVDEDMFEILIKNARQYNADISHCGYVMDFPDGHSDLYYGTGNFIIQNNITGQCDLLEGKFVEPGLWNKIYKKDLIEKYIENQNMDYSIKNLEDLLVNYLLFKESKLSIYQDVCKYHYRLRKSSAATKDSRNKFEDPIKVFKLILSMNENKDLYNVVYRRYIYQLVKNANQRVYKDIRNKSKKILKREMRELYKHSLSKKLICMCIGVIYLNPLYVMIVRLYNTITRVDKKYDIKEKQD